MQSTVYRVLSTEYLVRGTESKGSAGRLKRRLWPKAAMRFEPHFQLGDERVDAHVGQGSRVPTRLSPVLPEHPLPLEMPLQPE